MDFDDDGHLDLISGSYDPGEVYLFRGLGDGTFAPRETITDRDGNPVLKVPDQRDRVESFGSWAAMVDWDDDGELDLLVGTFDAMIFLRRNEGTRAEPVFAAENEWVMAGDKPLRLPGGEHANPVVVDFDGDGLWDLVSGAGNGGVYWYRNVGDAGSPKFEGPVTLVTAYEGSGRFEILRPEDGPKPGLPSQIAVTDYDGDGKLDLLLGDFCTYRSVRPDLSPVEREEFESTLAQINLMEDVMKAITASTYERFNALMDEAGVPRDERHLPENQEVLNTLFQERAKDPQWIDQLDEWNRLRSKLEGLNPYIKPGEGSLDGRDDVPHGYVWLFRGK